MKGIPKKVKRTNELMMGLIIDWFLFSDPKKLKSNERLQDYSF
jgi:hypothetical protein